jgi:hypothetical protein
MPYARDKTIDAGFRIVFFSQLNADGYAVGGNGVVIAGAGGGSPSLRLDGARTVDLTSPDPVVENVSGDDNPMVSFQFQSEETPNGVLEVSVGDNLEFSYLTGLPRRTDVATADMLYRETPAVPPDVCFIFQRRNRSWAPGHRGTKGWEGQYVLKANVSYQGSPFEQRTFQPHRLSITTSRSARHIWGETFSGANDEVSEAGIIRFTADNPVHLHTFRGNNAATNFTCRYTPLDAATGGIFVTVNGVAQVYGALNDYTVAGHVITFNGGSVPAANAIIEALYQFDEAEL